MKPQGLFIGLATLDIIYLIDSLPQSNQKIVAQKQIISAGGPASNAAVSYSYWGNQAKLIGVIGSHSLSYLIKADLSNYGVEVLDLEENRLESPPVSSIFVTRSTGERAVISVNATKSQGDFSAIPSDILTGIDLILLDGHQMGVSEALAPLAKQQHIPVIVDGGSWKPGFEKVLPWVDYAICSANFFPPGCEKLEDVFIYLEEMGIKQIAVTQGEKPIEYLSEGKRGNIAIASQSVVDTLGAGDIFHGAFCHYIREQGFIEALASAAKIAGYSCQFFGTREWMS